MLNNYINKQTQDTFGPEEKRRKLRKSRKLVKFYYF